MIVILYVRKLKHQEIEKHAVVTSEYGTSYEIR